MRRGDTVRRKDTAKIHEKPPLPPSLHPSRSVERPLDDSPLIPVSLSLRRVGGPLHPFTPSHGSDPGTRGSATRQDGDTALQHIPQRFTARHGDARLGNTKTRHCSAPLSPPSCIAVDYRSSREGVRPCRPPPFTVAFTLPLTSPRRLPTDPSLFLSLFINLSINVKV